MKKYIAKSDLSVNVTLKGGHHMHITFDSMTGGGSTYYTDNEDVQNALERHRYFDRFFTVDEVVEEAPKEENVTVEETKDKEYTVECVDDAKDLLSERYGVSRTKMKTLDAVKKAAESVGVTLKGI